MRGSSKNPIQEMTDQIQFGSRTIRYRVRYSDRKTLGITVHPDIEVEVKAPLNANAEKIRERMKKKAPWIIKQQSFFLSFEPRTPKRKFIPGESHLYLGRNYKLVFVKTNEEKVVLSGGQLIAHAKTKTRIEPLMIEWYLQKARERFEKIATPLIQRFQKYGVKPSGIVLRNMPTRWGSCTPKGKIILNPELIKAPKPCIEYVIIHELCHLVHHDHTKAFLDLQTKKMRDWEKWKDKLERLLA